MPERMLVHVLLFKEKKNDHLQLVIEIQNQFGSLYYNIDQWSLAKTRLDKTIRAREQDDFIDKPFDDFILSADECCTIAITADIEEVIQSWSVHQSETSQHCYQAVKHNCADAVIWFLNRYANMPEPSWRSQPVTYHHAFFCCVVPSVFNCISIPDRVMHFIKQWAEDNKLAITDEAYLAKKTN